MDRKQYQAGYRQAFEDFSKGTGYKPHKLRNLMPLVVMGVKKEDAFLKGYQDGYAECQYKTMQQEAEQRFRASGPSQQTSHTSRSQPRVEELRRLRERRRDEPEYGPER